MKNNYTKIDKSPINWRLAMILIFVVTCGMSVSAQVTSVTQLGSSTGWYSDDTRTTAGVNLVGLTQTYHPYYDYLNGFTSSVTVGATQAVNTWYTDRYAPAGFTTATLNGNSVLKHSISAADCESCRPSGFNIPFYNTQGRKFDLAANSSKASIDLYIPAAWASTGARMAGFWGDAQDATNANSGWPIVEFVSDNSNPRFRAYDDGVWVDMGLPTGFTYDSFVKLEMELLPSGEFLLKAGSLQYTTQSLAQYNTTHLANIILQGHNIGVSGASYDIYWDNLYCNNNGTTADDAAISQQIKFSRLYAGSYNNGGLMELDGTTNNSGKSSVKYYTGSVIAPGSALSSFNATFRWYCDPYSTSRTPALSLLVRGSNNLTYSFAYVGPSAVINTWNTFNATSASPYWSLFSNGAPGGAVVKSLTDWLADPTYGSILSNGSITAEGFNIGSYQRYCRIGIDWLESSILNGGARIDFGAPQITYYVNNNSTSGDVYTTAVGNDSNAGTASAPFATIAHAISLANDGDIIKVDAGTFNENVTVDKRITLNGVGATTILTPISIATPVINVTASGLDASNRLVIKNLAITGTSNSSGSDGIAFVPSSTASYLTVENVSVSTHGQGIHFRSSSFTGVLISNCTLNGNNFGVRSASAVTSFNGLTIDGCTMNNNSSSAITVNPSLPANPNLTNFTVSNSTFNNNSTAGSINQHDLSFYGFSGNATLTNVSVTSGNGASANSNSNGIVFTNGSGYVSAGTIALNNVTVSGFVGKGALSFQLYNNTSNISLTDVNVSNCVAPWGQVIIDQQGAGTFNLGNTTLKTLVLWNAASVNATSAIFKNYTSGATLDRNTLADCFQIENQVTHATDNASLGLVLVKANNVYVTTTSGSIQRGINAATAGNVVNVAAGTYSEQVNVNKSVTLLGAQANVALSNGGGTRTGGESIILGGTSATVGVGYQYNEIDINADNVEVNGFECSSNKNYGITTNNSATGTHSNVKIKYNYIHSNSSVYVGIVLGLNVSTATFNNYEISHNYINAAGAKSISFSGGVATVYGSLNFTYNEVTNSGSGSGIFVPGASLTSPVINYNNFHDITGNGSDGIHTCGISNGDISHNTITNCGGSGAWVSMQGGTFTYNTISNCQNSFTLYGSTYGAPTAANVEIANNYFTYNDNATRTSTLGLRIPAYTTTSDVNAATLNVHDNSIINGAATSSAGCYAIKSLSSSQLTTSCNWFGETSSQAIAPLIMGSVTYSPWLVNGTNLSSSTGFQPSGACSGIPIVISSTTGNNATCNGQANGSIAVSFTGGYGAVNITWTGGSASSISSPYTISNIGAGTYSIVVTDANGSTVSTSVSISEPGLPAAASVISGNNSACKPGVAGEESFSVSSSTDATNYTWSYSGTGSPSITGNGTTNIALNWTALNMQSGVIGTLTVTPSDNCGHSGAASSIAIEYQISSPIQPSSVSGASKACPGDSLVTYSISAVSRATSYIWTMPAGMVIKSGANTNTIQVAVRSAFAGGNISVYASNVCGVSPTRNKSISVSLPAVPGAIAGKSVGVCNSGVLGNPNAYTYSIGSISGASSYLWTVPTGLSITSGQGTNSIVVASTSNYSTGSITVSAVNGCGASASRSLTVKGAPDRPAAITYSGTVCAPSVSSVAYTSTTVDNVASYNWVVSYAGVIATPSTGKAVLVDWISAAASQYVRVTTSNTCGSSLSRSLSGINVAACARLGDTNGTTITAYPNPASDNVNVEFNSENAGHFNLTMIDMTGRTVLSQAGTTEEGLNKLELNVRELSGGIYLIVLDKNNLRETTHIVVK